MRLLPHLIKQNQAEALLVEFAALDPGSSLALIYPDGSVFATAGKKQFRPEDFQIPLAETRSILAGGEIVGFLASHPVAAPSLTALQRIFNVLLQTALEKRDVARETLDRYREINLLYKTAETIGACLDADQIPSLVLQESARVIPAKAGLVLLRAAEGEGDLELQAFYPNSDRKPLAEEIIEDLWASGLELIGHVMQTGRPDIRSNANADLKNPFHSLLCSPLKARERALGVVLLGRVEGAQVTSHPETRTTHPVEDEPNQFTAGEQKLLTALTSQAGIAIEKAWLHRQEIQRQRLEQELSIGRRIQHSLLPEALPDLPGWEFAVYYQTAREIGGDFYDFYETGNAEQVEAGSSSLGIFIADVTGKGVPAALMMAFNRAMLHTLWASEPEHMEDPSIVLQRLNHLIVHDNRTGLLLTALYAHLNPHNGLLTIANAGHEQPYWLHVSNGECQPIDARGMILGAFPNITFEAVHVELAPGDLLVIYTDGLSEARDESGQLFGEDKVAEVVRSLVNLTAQEALQTILARVQEFAGSTPQADDFTILVVRRSPEQ